MNNTTKCGVRAEFLAGERDILIQLANAENNFSPSLDDLITALQIYRQVQKKRHAHEAQCPICQAAAAAEAA